MLQWRKYSHCISECLPWLLKRVAVLKWKIIGRISKQVVSNASPRTKPWEFWPRKVYDWGICSSVTEGMLSCKRAGKKPITRCIWPGLVKKPGQDQNLGVGTFPRFVGLGSPRERGEGKIVPRGWRRNNSQSSSWFARGWSNPYLQWRFVLAHSMLCTLLWIKITFCDNNKCITLGWDIVNNENFFHSVSWWCPWMVFAKSSHWNKWQFWSF